MTARRTGPPRGQGTAPKRDPKTGLWFARVDFGEVDGRRVRVTRKAKTLTELDEKIAQLLRTKANGEIPEPASPGPGARRGGAHTVASWCEHLIDKEWPDAVANGNMAEGTLDTYTRACRNWITPPKYLGDIPLADLHLNHLKEWARQLRADGLAGSVRNARLNLHRVIELAVHEDLIPANVVKKLPAPKTTPKVDDSLTLEEAERALMAARGDRLEAAYQILLMVGLRQGEVLRMRWPDIDLRAGTLKVRGTKTKAAKRTVPLPPDVVATLKRHRTAQRTERMAAQYWADPEVVFATPEGTAYSPEWFRARWHELRAKARIPARPGKQGRRMHAARHTAATLMLKRGVPLEVVSKILGHASIAVTADIYAHLDVEDLRAGADAMQTLLGRGE